MGRQLTGLLFQHVLQCPLKTVGLIPSRVDLGNIVGFFQPFVGQGRFA